MLLYHHLRTPTSIALPAPPPSVRRLLGVDYSSSPGGTVARTHVQATLGRGRVSSLSCASVSVCEHVSACVNGPCRTLSEPFSTGRPWLTVSGHIKRLSIGTAGDGGKSLSFHKHDYNVNLRAFSPSLLPNPLSFKVLPSWFPHELVRNRVGENKDRATPRSEGTPRLAAHHVRHWVTFRHYGKGSQTQRTPANGTLTTFFVERKKLKILNCTGTK